MKKLLLATGTVFILGIAAYSSITSYSKASNTYNNEEYYYNDETDSTEEDEAMTPDTSTNTSMNTITQNATAIDTTPDSITILVNKEYSLPSDYVPADLMEPNVLFNINYHDDKRMLRAEAAHALEDLFAAAQKDGLIFYGISGYRSYARQEEIYQHNILTMGLEHTNLYSAKPGYSEHQTGLSIDVSTISVNNRLDEGFAATPESAWLENNAYRYGFIIRYPKDKSDITGYSYEPWHIRYVGIDLAAYLSKNDLTLEEYYNYTPSKVLTEDDSYGTVIDVENGDYSEPDASESPAPSASPTISPKPAKPAKTKAPIVTPTPVPSTPEPEPEPTITPVPTLTPVPEVTPSVSPTVSPNSPEQTSPGTSNTTPEETQ